MNFLKKRLNAIIISAIVVLLSVVFGSARSASAEAKKVNSEFSSGDWSITSQLKTRLEATMNMCSIINSNYTDNNELVAAAEELLNARRDLADKIDSGESASVLYKSNTELQTKGDALYTILEGLSNDLSNDDADLLSSEFKRFYNAQYAIGDNTYNEAVTNFNKRVLSFFPLNIIKAFISTPEKFA